MHTQLRCHCRCHLQHPASALPRAYQRAATSSLAIYLHKNTQACADMPAPSPARFAASITARPTAPRPNTATLAPACTLAVLNTAPQPVATPQPSRHTWQQQQQQRWAQQQE
jgi:hypothetical protein